MAKNSFPSVKQPRVSVKATAGVPGDASRARMMETQGQKVMAPQAAPIATPKMQAPQNIAGAGSDMLMPVNHPAAKTTRTVGKGGSF